MRQQGSGSKPAVGALQRFSPDDAPSNDPTIDSLRAVPSGRMRYRAVVTWGPDPTTGAGHRQEAHEFADPRKVLALVRNIEASPHRPIIDLQLEARIMPRWFSISRAALIDRAESRDRRDELHRRMREHAARKAGGS